MGIAFLLLIIALAAYVALALSTTLRAKLGFDMTALGLALVCLTMLVGGGRIG